MWHLGKVTKSLTSPMGNGGRLCGLCGDVSLAIHVRTANFFVFLLDFTAC